MTPIPQLLRDSLYAAILLVVVGAAFGQGIPVGAGAVGGVLNLVLLARAVQRIGSGGSMLPLLGKHAVGLAILFVLIRLFDVVPVLVGFCAPVVALGARGVFGLFRPVPPAPAENG